LPCLLQFFGLDLEIKHLRIQSTVLVFYVVGYSSASTECNVFMSFCLTSFLFLVWQNPALAKCLFIESTLETEVPLEM